MRKSFFYLVLVFSLVSQTNQAKDFSYAIKLYHDKFYDLAVKEFDNFIKAYPQASQRPEAIFYLALSYVAYQDEDKALENFRRVAIDYPNYLKADEAWFKSALILKNKEKWKDAAAAFETIKLLYAKSAFTAEALYLASQMYEKAGAIDKAMFTCRIILDEYSESAFYERAKIQLIRLLRLDGKLAEAKLELSKLKSSSSIEFDILFETAQIEKLERNYQRAEELLQQIATSKKAFPQMNVIYMELGDLAFRRNDYVLAKSYYLKSKKKHESTQLHEKLGDSYFLTNDFSNAVKSYKKSKSIEAEIKLALSLSRLKRNKEASAVYKDILKKDFPTLYFDDLIYERAHLLEKENDHLESVSFIEANLPRVQNTAIAIELSRILGESYEKRLEYDLALGTYNRFLLAHPSYYKNDLLLWKKAELLEKNGQINEAAKIYREINNFYPLSPYFQKVEEKLANYRNATKLSKTSIYKQLSNILSSLIEGSNKSKMYLQLADLNAKQLAEYSTAIAYYKKALEGEANPNEKVKIHLKIADNYMSLAASQKNDSLYQSAFRHYGELLKSKPSPELRFTGSVGLIRSQLNQIASEQEKNQKAIKYYSKLIKEHAENPESDGIRLVLADFFEKASNHQSAISTLGQIKTKKFLEESYYRLGNLYLESDSLLRSADYFREILTRFPKSKKRYLLLEKLSTIEEKLGRKENSILFKKMMLDDYPHIENEKNKSAVVQYLLAKGKITEAKNYVNFKAAERLSDDFLLNKVFRLVSNESLLQIARVYDFDGENQKAIKAYLDYLRFSNNGRQDNQIYDAIAQIYFEDNRRERALQYFEKITSDYEDYEQIEQSLAILYFQTEHYAKAAEYSKRVLKRIKATDSAFITLNRNYLISLIKSKSLKNFRTQLDAYAKKFPNDKEGQAAILYEYALAERRKKNFTRSNKILDEIIDDYDETSYVDDASYLTGLNYVTVNNFEKAMDILGEFPKEFPNSSILAKYYNSMGSIFEQFGKVDQAVEAYKQALVHAKDENTKKLSYAKLITSYNKMGLSESVISTATSFVQLYPTDPKVFDIKILIGQALSNLNRGTEAVRYLKQLKLEASSESEPEVQYWIASSYYKMKQYESAISEYIKIPLLSKKTKLQWVPSALFYAGQSYEKLGKKSDAIRMYERIVSTPGIDAVFKKDARKRIKLLGKS